MRRACFERPWFFSSVVLLQQHHCGGLDVVAGAGKGELNAGAGEAWGGGNKEGKQYLI